MGELQYADDDMVLERWLIAMSARFFFRLLHSLRSLWQFLQANAGMVVGIGTSVSSFASNELMHW